MSNWTFRDTDGVARLVGDSYLYGGSPGFVATVGANNRLVAAPASGGAPGAPVVRGPFAIAFGTAGLNNGVTFYTPTIGDILLDCWIEVDTAWNGTTPLCDIGPFLAPGDAGFYAQAAGAAPVDMTQADAAYSTVTALLNNPAGNQNLSGYLTSLVYPGDLVGAVKYPAPGGSRVLPAKFVTADPWKVVVSQDGLAGGASPGATTGAGGVYIVTATPTPLP